MELIKKEQNNIEKVRHSLSHLLAEAVLKQFPGAKLGIGPVIENGFYYDIDLGDSKLAEKNLQVLENRIKGLVKKGLAFTKEVITHKEAKELFKDQPYKLELIEDLEREGKEPTIYITKDKDATIFTDLCVGPHVDSTTEIDPESFKLQKIAGAYWRGSEKNQMLTRIYGVAFENKEALDQYLLMMEEAEKRDHRKLGKELDLFHIDDIVGLGLPLWHPKGALLWRIIEDFWYEKHLQGGYDLVRSPHIGNRSLWETSGHWGFYNKSMYPPLEVGQTLEDRQHEEKAKTSEEYLLKPMNCPFHVQIYKNDIRSYRSLPFRWAECGTVYRFEKKGELSGLTRVRGFTQDDAHIICRKDQVEYELKRVIDFILFMYKSFGFNIEDVHVYLSLRDPKDKSNYAGSDEGWEFSEGVLRKVAQEKGLNFEEEEGEAAFYGPKLDFKIRDAIGREWQCSTLQFDFNLPERFDMSFINNKGEQERPYMLHRALFGSYERFIGLLIEHYAGAFPLWLSPTQVTILNVGEDHLEYAKEVADKLREGGVRVEVADENTSVGKKIRSAEMKKTPYVLVVGDKEVEARSVAVRKRGEGDLGVKELDVFIEEIKGEIKK
ncbi:MAG: Threonine-tRNA ligase [Candidatus Wolfebacteria bacterium GW2011_GWE1_48_7]|nr:MAG: Threonine-tRNA ligase [Candidatus Wolfebacteria bacterium GW2011_GWC2_46_275]KKU65778.1 MAG: Threonine-tRNA ligase [Candidatus Wolfebacteria bacterium GW2011_GWD2_47_17]KKU73324.1 MAG: Threonine-tRNA ligase [Candidatus Wolfebacteria bacterium GW2011_GWB1_47_243]KKU88710.1 MAG: Threonine-tRNA ligase [Candidatus Wolfebacteria bacterium GW2011_GWA2_47_9b]KKU99843.1 MAG: Threonine-tRNA ligase [Candidatus Wolfebacteria bacterium GW2011_GWE1_48_7]